MFRRDTSVQQSLGIGVSGQRSRRIALDAPSWRYTGFLVGICAVLGIWLLDVMGVLAPLDGMVYDYFMRLSTRSSHKPSSVLLVEIKNNDNSSAKEDILSEAMETIENLGAREVIFNFLPEDFSPTFYQKAASYGNVVFGRELIPDPDDPEKHELVPVPRAALGQAIHFGIVTLPPNSHGVAREQHAYFSTDDNTYPALEVAAAVSVIEDKVSVPSQNYLVNFLGGPNRLPNVSLERVVNDGIVSELVKGRTVLIGSGIGGTMPGLFTPTTTDQETMSLLEFQGNALNTILSRIRINELGPVAKLAVLLLIGIVSIFLYQRLRIIWASWLTAAILALYLLLAAALFIYARIWLPIVEIVLAQSIIFFIVLRQNAALSNFAMERLLFDLSSKLRERLWPTSFYISDEYWSQVITMLNQTLDLNRSIFLAPDETGYRVREVISLNCSLASVNETQRDYRFEPYNLAVKTQGPIRVDQNHSGAFLKGSDLKENQYLVPLVFAGELFGFWAFGVDPTKAAEVPMFVSLVGDYSKEIGELLYRRRQFIEEQSSGTLLNQLLYKRGEEVYKLLHRTVGLMERRLTRVENLLNEMNTAAAVYDPFGRLMVVNTQMIELLNKEGLAPYNLTALDLVSELTGEDLTISRRFLRHIIIDRNPITLPVSLSSEYKHYVLNMWPLLHKEREGFSEDPAPFGLAGIVCELVDRTASNRLDEIKGHLSQRLGVELRNDLATIELSTSLLSSGQLPDEQIRDVSEIVYSKVKKAVDVLEECQQYLTMDVYRGEQERFPVDAQYCFRFNLDALRPILSDRGVSVDINQPLMMGYVFASPAKLQQVFEYILTVLVKDAFDNSAIRIEVQDAESWVTYLFQNSGFAIPNERLQEYLIGSEELASDELRNLRNAIQWVKGWGGNLEAKSEIGTGMTITLRLQRFF